MAEALIPSSRRILSSSGQKPSFETERGTHISITPELCGNERAACAHLDLRATRTIWKFAPFSLCLWRGPDVARALPISALRNRVTGLVDRCGRRAPRRL